MADKKIPLDAAEQAVRMAEMEGKQELLASEVRSNMVAFRSSMEAMQADVRTMANAVRDLASLSHSNESNKEAIDEVKASVNALTERLERWSEAFSSENKERWEKHDRERDKWRTAHEADNQRTKDRMILWTGIGFSFLLLGGAVVSGFVYFLNMRFAESDADVERVERAAELSRIDRTKMMESIHRIELYIAEEKGHEQ
jgi:hypothetical protein